MNPDRSHSPPTRSVALAARFVLGAMAWLAIGACTAPACAQGAPPISFDVLKGRWVRPDGGYTISITSVAADGKIDAAYANPRPLPFAVAQATREGNTLRAFFELRAGGYDGSTYTLVYDPAADALKGAYYQAVARQRFNVQFARAQ